MQLLRRLAPSAIPVRPRASFHLCPTPAFPISLPNSTPRRVPQRRFKSASTMAATDATLRAFFQSPKFAVVGASTNTAKYGYKVFAWYTSHNLPVTPINPTSSSIPVNGVSYPTVSSLSDLPGPDQSAYGVSVITPPAVTLKTLEQAKALGIQAVFLQPGTFDDAVLEFAKENFEIVLAGQGGHGGEGWCVLVDGERGLKGAGKL